MIDLTSRLNLQLDTNLKVALHEAESRYLRVRAEAISADDQVRVTDEYFTEVFDLYAGFILSQAGSLEGQQQFETMLDELSVSLLTVLMQVLLKAHGIIQKGKGSHINRISVKLDSRGAHWKAHYLATVLDEHSALRKELARQSKSIGVEEWCRSQSPRLSLGAVKLWRAKRWGPKFEPNNRISDEKRHEIEHAIRFGPLARKGSAEPS